MAEQWPWIHLQLKINHWNKEFLTIYITIFQWSNSSLPRRASTRTFPSSGRRRSWLTTPDWWPWSSTYRRPWTPHRWPSPDGWPWPPRGPWPPTNRWSWPSRGPGPASDWTTPRRTSPIWTTSSTRRWSHWWSDQREKVRVKQPMLSTSM